MDAGISPHTSSPHTSSLHALSPSSAHTRRPLGALLATCALLALASLLVVPAPAAAVDGFPFAVFPLTDNACADLAPSVWVRPPDGGTSGGLSGAVVWAGQTAPGSDTEIMRYDLATRLTTQLTSDFVDDTNPIAFDDGNVAWTKGLGLESEVFVYLASTAVTLQITTNGVCDGQVTAAGDLVAYVRDRTNPTEKPTQVLVFDAGTRAGLRLDSDSLRDEDPHTDGHWVAWVGWDATDPEIYLWDGTRVQRLTNNDTVDLPPVVCNQAVTWAGFDGHDWEIYRYEDGRISQLTDTPGSEVEPACASGPMGDYIAWAELTTPRTLWLALRPAGATTFTVQRIGQLWGDGPVLDLSPVGLCWVAPDLRGGPDGEIAYREHLGEVVYLTDNGPYESAPRISQSVVTWVSGFLAEAEVWLAVPDGAPPTAVVTMPDDGGVVGGAPGDAATIAGTAEDDAAVERVWVSMDGGATWDEAVIDSGRFTPLARWSFDWPLPAEDYVAHPLAVRVLDSAGNLAVVEPGGAGGRRTVVVDTVAPRLSTFRLNEGRVVSHSERVLVELVGVDGSPRVESTLNNLGECGVDWIVRPRLSVWRLQPGLGLRTVEVQLADVAGNRGGPWSASVTVEQGEFRDVAPSHPYSLAVYALRAAGVVHGYATADGWEFRPENSLWRAQFAKMICGVLGLPVTEDLTSPFQDLGPDDSTSLYPHEYVAAAYAAGITVGTSPTSFSPWAEITRAQLVTMVVRAVQGRAPGALVGSPPGWPGTLGLFDLTHGPTMRIAEYNGLLAGMEGFGPSWDPWAPASRGEAAELLFRLMMLLET